jgi:hypothetical protein
MIVVKHICFFYVEERIRYINNIIQEANKYKYITDIFIHTNSPTLSKECFDTYTNGSLHIIYHDLTNEHPFYLSWKCRKLLKKQKDDYDIFMYIEDDILVPMNALEYWLKYNEKMTVLGYNLGFVRIEIDDNNTEFITDLPGVPFNTTIDLDNETFCVNNINPYCAFWIYNKKEFNRYVDSDYYNLNNIMGYGIRESSAIGLHGLNTKWYKDTLIPVKNGNLIDDCKIYHMPNNYIKSTQSFAKIPFQNCIKKK